MGEDLLKELLRRRGGAAVASAEGATAALEVVGGTDAAENVEGKNRVGGWLDIRPLRGPGSLISYSELLQVDYDRPNLTFIVLIFRHVMVTVRGRNLEALFSGIQMRLTKAIQQHDPKKILRPYRMRSSLSR